MTSQRHPRPRVSTRRACERSIHMSSPTPVLTSTQPARRLECGMTVRNSLNYSPLKVRTVITVWITVKLSKCIDFMEEIIDGIYILHCYILISLQVKFLLWKKKYILWTRRHTCMHTGINIWDFSRMACVNNDFSTTEIKREEHRRMVKSHGPRQRRLSRPPPWLSDPMHQHPVYRQVLEACVMYV